MQDICYTNTIELSPLSREFFKRNTVEVAHDLLGTILCFNMYLGVITETEAYRGADDPASHAFKGQTKRTYIMFDTAGVSYVYLIYGMYYCLNISTEAKGVPGAVLVRGLQLIRPDTILLDGPGKICRKLEITLAHNNIDITINNNFYISKGVRPHDVIATPRIGIKAANDKLWRFVSSSRK